MPSKLMKFQREVLQEIEGFNGRCLVAMDMGLGKGPTSLHYVLNHPELRPVVIVCAASLKWHWEREALRHIGIRCEILEGAQPKRRRIWTPNTIWIVNYDILGPTKHGPGWLKFLKELGPKLIIIDECQAIKGLRTKRTKNAKLLCKKVKHILALSGTPLTNRPIELWPILSILHKEYRNFHSFTDRWCSRRKTLWGWDYSGARRLPSLHRSLLKNVMTRRTKQEVLPYLPSKTREVITLPVIDEKEYNTAVNDFRGWLRNIDPGKARRATKAEKIVQLGYLKRLAATLKKKAVLEWIDNFLEESNEKLILFAIHKSMVKSIHERYDDISVIVTGEVTGKKRQRAFDQFNHSKTTRLFIGNIDAAGVGWSATDCCNVAFVEFPWTPGALTQAEDRVHGIKRGKKGMPVLCSYLVARNTIEETLCKLLQKKEKIIRSVLDGKKARNQLDIFDKLCEIIEREKR